MALLLAGCAGQYQTRGEALRRDQGTPRILLMPMDVELSELSPGGTEVPNGDWTHAGMRNIETAATAFLNGRGARLVAYVPPPADSAESHDDGQLVALDEVLGGHIKSQQEAPTQQIPTKGARFDWSLGPAAVALGKRYAADYALFVHVKDSYMGVGRMVYAVVAFSVLGVYDSGGHQRGSASLVDLSNGNVVWHHAFSRNSGDLREAGVAAESVRLLLNGLPR
ncbi:MAG: hypothetical protein H7840_15645 [Alphaproteobacteria bacterium]